MPEIPYSDAMYSSLDDSEDEALYAAHAGLGLGDSSYVPGGMGGGRPRREGEEEEVILSPSDGYFGRSGSAPAQDVLDGTSSPTSILAASSQVAHVPNVWVSDPSLEQGSTADSKAREARGEPWEQNRSLDTRLNPASGRHFQQQQQYIPSTSTSTSTSNSNSTPRDGSSSAFSLLNPQPLPPQPPTSAAGVPSSSSSTTTTTPSYRAQRHTPLLLSSSSTSAAAGPSRPRRSATIYSERSSLFSEAPPAYTPSPTSPTSASSSYNSNNNDNNYQTFTPAGTSYNNTNHYYYNNNNHHPHSLHSPHNNTNMGRASESESHGLLAGQTYQSIPESMGGEPEDDGHFTYPQPTGWRDRIANLTWRKQWKLVLLGLVLAFVTVGFLVSSVSGLRRQRIVIVPGDKAPVTRPPATGDDDDGTRLAYRRFDDYPMWASNQLCGTRQIKYNSVTFAVEYSLARNVSIFQDVQEGDHPANGKDIHVSGDVVLRRSGPGTPEPSIVVEATSNDDRIAMSLDWDDKEQRMNMRTPLSIPWPSNPQASSPCMQIRVTMWVAPGSELDSLNVQNVHLGVQLLDNLSLRLGSFARLASTVGPIASATDGEKDAVRLMREAPPASFRLDTRFLEVKTMSSPVSGSWPLYDYLGLETISGAIQAGVQPKDVLAEKPLPAILYAHSISGHLEIYEPVDEAMAAWAAVQQDDGLAGTRAAEDVIPPREYTVDLYSMAGPIKATVAFGLSCKVHTTSGHVDLTLLPVLDTSMAAADAPHAAPFSSKKNSLLTTSTTSGTTSIAVLETLWTDIDAGRYTSTPTPPAAPAAPVAPREPLPIGDSDPYEALRPEKRVEIIQLSPAGAPSVPGVHTVPFVPVMPVVAAVAAPPGPPALRALTSRHTATSAAVTVSYPASWEGYIDADSLSGRIEVGGQGVKIVRRENEYPGIKRQVLAHKGADGAAASGMIKVHTTSGNVGVHIRSPGDGK